MHPEPQTTYLRVELLHPPKDYRDKRVFDKVNLEIGEFAPVYSQLQVFGGGTGASLTGKVEETQYVCEFRRDRLLVSEHNPRLGLADFDQNLLKIVNLALKTLQVQFFIAQSSIVRCVFMPSNFSDARVFLGERVCSLKDEISALAKAGPMHIFGLRFVFPATPQRRLAHNVRVESLLEDPRKVWVENGAVFASRPITPAELSVISQNIRETSRFVEEDIFNFLAQFDTKKE
jgi:hypothetical protein